MFSLAFLIGFLPIYCIGQYIHTRLFLSIQKRLWDDTIAQKHYARYEYVSVFSLCSFLFCGIWRWPWIACRLTHIQKNPIQPITFCFLSMSVWRFLWVCSVAIWLFFAWIFSFRYGVPQIIEHSPVLFFWYTAAASCIALWLFAWLPIYPWMWWRILFSLPYWSAIIPYRFHILCLCIPLMRRYWPVWQPRIQTLSWFIRDILYIVCFHMF